MTEDLLKTMATLMGPRVCHKTRILPQICDFFFPGDTTIEKVTVEIKGVFPIRGRHLFVCKSHPHTLFKEFQPQSNGRGLTHLGRGTLGSADPPTTF